MTQLHLNFYQRVMIWNLIGAHQVPNLKEAATYLRVIEKVRLTDEELTRSEFVNEGGRMSWRLPDRDYGSKTINLEQEEAKAIATALEQAPVRVSDAEWMLHLTHTLTATNEVAK